MQKNRIKPGVRFRRPDGTILVLENHLPDGSWGCDLLEDPEGYPDPHGYPACHNLKIPAADLAAYEPL